MIGTRTGGVADSLMDSLAATIGVPTERIIEFWLHRTRRGKSIITVRFDASDVASPPIQRVYSLVEVPDAEHPPNPNPGAEIPTSLNRSKSETKIRSGIGSAPTIIKPPGWTMDHEPQPTGEIKRRKTRWRNNQG